MMRLLFVDDDPLALEQIRREINHARLHYDVVFVDSGKGAQAALEGGEFDAIICDLRMPGMDGPELLATVRNQYPQVVRVCMSGAVDDADLMRAMPVTHQFLSKPVVGESLREVVDRACSLNSILHHQGIRTLVGRLNTLPATAQTFQDLSDAMTQPNTHTADISRIVSKDTALCVKTLQIVNSSFFRRPADHLDPGRGHLRRHGDDQIAGAVGVRVQCTGCLARRLHAAAWSAGTLDPQGTLRALAAEGFASCR